MEQKHLIFIAIFALLLPFTAHAANFDVSQHGVQNGDITDALLKVWKLACNELTPAKVVIPKGQWTLKQAVLEGPSKAPWNFRFTLSGGGTFDGNGEVAWTKNDCHKNKNCMKLPINLSFNFIDNTIVKDYSHRRPRLGLLLRPFQTPGSRQVAAVDSSSIPAASSLQAVAPCCCSGAVSVQRLTPEQPCFARESIVSLGSPRFPQDLERGRTVLAGVLESQSNYFGLICKNFHVNCISSRNVTFQRFRVSAPAESPNTNGLHIARGVGINIIETGDDCISMGDELSDVLIKNVRCGPGHGISIGSLGKNVQEKDVSRITIDNCTFINSDNGVRIKTWPSAPATLKITDLTFTNINMVNVSNPIIFDQQYCPWNLCSLDKASLIQISKVKIDNIKGTSFTQDVIIFSCSSSKPCQDVQIGNIDLKYIGDPKLGGPTTKCQNIKYVSTGKQNPPLCAQSSAPKPLPK
ncbi:galacturonan 1,4-alpha-galacturonidase [Salvia divinorum]|uniref:Galacturonan 1,4-alpha-galacturonidase n=1 Tax=Salvia divinorum TaxID=28513 RepID=A0ABD1HWW8_SALDI